MNDYEEMLKAFEDVYGEPESRFDREYLFAFALFTKGWERSKAFQQSVQQTAIYCSECGGLGNAHTVMCSQFGATRRR